MGFPLFSSVAAFSNRNGLYPDGCAGRYRRSVFIWPAVLITVSYLRGTSNFAAARADILGLCRRMGVASRELTGHVESRARVTSRRT